jgi:hypothetical protein
MIKIDEVCTKLNHFNFFPYLLICTYMLYAGDLSCVNHVIKKIKKINKRRRRRRRRRKI